MLEPDLPLQHPKQPSDRPPDHCNLAPYTKVSPTQDQTAERAATIFRSATPWSSIRRQFQRSAVHGIKPIMDTDQIDVWDLKRHWQAIADGQMPLQIAIRCLPPWEDICEYLGWRRFAVTGGHLSEKEHGYCGVYRLIVLDAPGADAKPRSISRARGQDGSGTLYIGCASALHVRVNQLRRSLLRRERSHRAAEMLSAMPAWDAPNDRLAIAVLFTQPCMRAVERDLIRAYMNAFGDTPPLNYRL